MKKMFLFVISVALLLLTVGCNKVEEPPSEATPDSAIEEEQNPVESAIYRFTAEVVKYGNDALYVKVIDAGDSTLSIDDELYVGVANGYDDYPIGCTVEVAYSSEVIVDDYGIGRTLSVFNVEESPSEATPDSAIEEEQTSNESIPAPITLKVTDLISVFDTLDLTEANLTYHGETETTYPASTAIRAEGYIEKLKSFVWEEYTPPAEWNGDLGFFCQLTTPDITITSLQTGYNNSCPLHLITDEGEGWFVLPTIGYEDPNANKQLCWMIYDTFFSWHTETQAAFLYSEEGTPLTAEEMDYFQEYTKATWTEYDAEWGGFVGGATEISCFFTSLYSDPRDINAGEFLAYCPNENVLTKEDTDEFRLVQEKLDWRVGADNHLATFDEFPVPCHRIPRTFLNEILMKYAGITVEEMHTNWIEEAFYISETDCFYTFSSDFGPGSFIPCYGEKDGDIVTLWAAPAEYDGSTSMLTLQKSGESWHILSHTTISN